MMKKNELIKLKQNQNKSIIVEISIKEPSSYQTKIIKPVIAN